MEKIILLTLTYSFVLTKCTLCVDSPQCQVTASPTWCLPPRNAAFPRYQVHLTHRQQLKWINNSSYVRNAKVLKNTVIYILITSNTCPIYLITRETNRSPPSTSSCLFVEMCIPLPQSLSCAPLWIQAQAVQPLFFSIWAYSVVWPVQR